LLNVGIQAAELSPTPLNIPATEAYLQPATGGESLSLVEREMIIA
jgi:hypothetical protein